MLSKESLSLSYLITFIALTAILLAFDPGTNGNNLKHFSQIKLTLFILFTGVHLFVLFAPFLEIMWKRIINKHYLFLLLVFGLVDFAYLLHALYLFFIV